MAQLIRKPQRPGRSIRRNPDRWAIWVRTLIDRYKSIPLRRRGPALMTLRHPVIGITLLRTYALTMILARIGILLQRCQMWRIHAWHLFPQIQLALQWIPQRPSRKNALAPFSRRGDARSAEESSAIVVHQTSAKESVFLGRNSLEISGSGKKIPWKGAVEPINASPVWPESVTYFSRQGLTLQGIFRILRRVSHERYRVETKVHKLTVVRQQRNLAPGETERRAIASAPDRKVGAYSEPQTKAPYPMNVEQLTEQVIRQIDYRIGAYRERMGKPF